MLSPAALLAPPYGTGRLAVSLFAPETAEEVTARVRAYLAIAYADARVSAVGEAVGEAAQDAAVMAYAYAEAYDAKADLVHDDDATATVEGQGSRTTAPDQREHWMARAAEYRRAFDLAVSAVVVDGPPVAPGRGTVNGFYVVRGLR